jgi:hypothetical protein
MRDRLSSDRRGNAAATEDEDIDRQSSPPGGSANTRYVVGCRHCDLQRRVVGLETALDVYGEHKRSTSEKHRPEAWARTRLVDLGEEAPDYMPGVDVADDVPSPDPSTAGEGGSSAADVDD